MRFSYGVPFSCPLNPAFTTGPALSALAQQAEEAGFDAAYVTEHPAPSQRWREAGGHDALDPFVALTAMSCATTRLRLLTNLTVIPYRNPFLLAKASATLDVLSGGRLTLGAGVGYMKSEFAALGVDFETRNARFDEYLQVLKLAWLGETVTFEGEFVSARASPSTPRPPSARAHRSGSVGTASSPAGGWPNTRTAGCPCPQPEGPAGCRWRPSMTSRICSPTCMPTRPPSGAPHRSMSCASCRDRPRTRPTPTPSRR